MIVALPAQNTSHTTVCFMGSAIVVALLFTACSTPPQDLPAIHRGSKVHASVSGSILQASTGSRIQYTSYLPERLIGQTSVLFFAKDADPFSRLSDQRLKILYGTGAAGVSTYRVPFNESAELQLKYGVFVEDTFVLVGTGSERLGLIIHPSERELKEMIRGGNRRVGE
jgi:hypothetical protein